MQPQPPIAYSALLQEFVEPLLAGDETEEQFLQYCKFGMTVWNYHVCLKYRLKMLPLIEHAIKEGGDGNPDHRLMVDWMMQYKDAKFQQYDNIILSVTKSIKPDGSRTLQVESAPYFIVDETSVSGDIAEFLKAGVDPKEILGGKLKGRSH